MSKNHRYYIYNRTEMAAFLPRRYARVLEIGCGEGNFRTNLDQDCEYWGIEPVAAAAEVAATRLFRVINGTYDEAFDSLPDDYFDLVVCNDVIEHMTDYDSFFRTIKRKMGPNSFIIGSIPNVRFINNLTELLFKKEWKYKDEGILDRTHYRFFTEKSIQRVFDEHGYSIEEFYGINRFYPRKLRKRLLIRLLGRDTGYLQFGFRIVYRPEAGLPQGVISP